MMPGSTYAYMCFYLSKLGPIDFLTLCTGQQTVLSSKSLGTTCPLQQTFTMRDQEQIGISIKVTRTLQTAIAEFEMQQQQPQDIHLSKLIQAHPNSR